MHTLENVFACNYTALRSTGFKPVINIRDFFDKFQQSKQPQ